MKEAVVHLVPTAGRLLLSVSWVTAHCICAGCRFSHAEWSFVQSQFAYRSALVKSAVQFNPAGKYYEILEHWDDEDLKKPPFIFRDKNQDTIENQAKKPRAV
jgi:hypothetical protein